MKAQVPFSVGTLDRPLPGSEIVVNVGADGGWLSDPPSPEPH